MVYDFEGTNYFFTVSSVLVLDKVGDQVRAASSPSMVHCSRLCPVWYLAVLVARSAFRVFAPSLPLFRADHAVTPHTAEHRHQPRANCCSCCR